MRDVLLRICRFGIEMVLWSRLRLEFNKIVENGRAGFGRPYSRLMGGTVVIFYVPMIWANEMRKVYSQESSHGGSF